ncbi:dihydrofolate reductase family protein [Haloglycomyces albus]|uniref:dihydrofolate reductase family protein n=1 Tax=Haloglycomyces albus TaxID=526067 RepID=UPI0004B271C7|nr:dihydrofolate reductase family protein [Haloglycomyces albus]
MFDDLPIYVFTTRDLPTSEHSSVRFLSGAVADHLPTLRKVAAGGDIWIVGGGNLAAQFLDAGALDELTVTVAPATLDGGTPLFPRRVEPDRLSLVTTQRFGQFARLSYRVSG